MRTFLTTLSLALMLTACADAQTRTHSRGTTAPPAGVPVKPGTELAPASFPWEKGEVDGRTYSNKSLGFEVTFPDTWLIGGDDFEEEMRSKGVDLELKAPDSSSAVSKARAAVILKHVQVLVNAFRSVNGAGSSAIVRISAEDLAPNPQIKDAVDYVDAVRASYAAMRLPADFRYSETQAEKLPNGKQFAFLDTTTKEGKKRMYVTVRNGVAVLFTISYEKADDLETLRTVLGSGNFKLQ